MDTGPTHVTYDEVDLDLIHIPESHRAIDEKKVAELAKSIAETGLLHAIGLNRDHSLICGGHRIAAYRQLGFTKIPATIHDLDVLRFELAGIDENFVRTSLSDLEFSQALARRKELYLALHPETKPVTSRGGPGRGKKTSGKTPSVSSFTADTARRTGKSRSTVQRAVKTGENLDPEAAKTLAGTPAANNKSKLAEISRLPADTQRQVARQIAAEQTPKVGPVTNDHDSDRKRQAEKGLKALNTVMSALKARGLHHQHENHIQRIEADLKQAAAASEPDATVDGDANHHSETPGDLTEQPDNNLAEQADEEQALWTV